MRSFSDSPDVKPKSWKTSPIDSRTSFVTISTPLPAQDRLITQPGNFYIPLGGLLRFLLGGMKHVNRFPEFSHINDPMRLPDVNANFTNTQADGFHGLPVAWVLACLNLVKLISDPLPSLVGKVSKVIERCSSKLQQLHYTIVQSFIQNLIAHLAVITRLKAKRAAGYGTPFLSDVAVCQPVRVVPWDCLTFMNTWI